MKKLLSLVAAFMLSANLFAATQVEGGVGNLVVPKTYSNIGAWGGTWSGNQVANEKDWSDYEYVWIKYSGFEGALNFGVMYSEFKSHESWGDAYYDATVSPKDPSGVVGIKLDRTSTYTLGNKEEDGDYIGDIYAQHIREVFIQATSNGTNITIEEMWVGTEEEYLAAVEENKWVEVFVPDTEDPGVKAIPEGYMSLITNGTMEESDDVSSFFTKVNKGAPAPSVITDGVGRFEGHGITITSIDNASDGWDTQFWLMFTKPISSGTKIHIEFDYRASELTSVSTQQHNENCGYVDWQGLKGFSPSLNWKHFEQDFTTTADMQSIAFNLNDTKDKAITFYFDNFLAYTEIPAVEPFDDTKNHMLLFDNGTAGSNPWDHQANYTLPTALEKGKTYVFEADINAVNGGETRLVPQGDGSQYLATKGLWTNEFTKYKVEFEASGNFTSLEIDLGACGGEVYFDNVSLKEKDTDDNLIANGDFETQGTKGWKAVNNTMEQVENELGEVKNPGILVSVGEAGWKTFRTGSNVKISDSNVTAYAAKYIADGNYVQLTEVAEFASWQPVIIEAPQGNYMMDAPDNVTPVDDAINDLKANGGTALPGDGTLYGLAKIDGVVGFYKISSESEVPAWAIYLQIPEAEGRDFIGFSGDATTVKAIETLKQSGAIYNLAGQQVKNAQKGIFIIDGKKVIK